eukprot:1961781-Prorocentrum_lima.AAC.1
MLPDGASTAAGRLESRPNPDDSTMKLMLPHSTSIWENRNFVMGKSLPAGHETSMELTPGLSFTGPFAARSRFPGPSG